MRVTDVDVRESARGTAITATVVWDRRRRTPDRLRFDYRDVGADAVVTPGDALAAAVLMPAMAEHEDVVVDAPVSEQLHTGMRGVTETWTIWRPDWYRSEVTAEMVDRSALSPAVVASCFSAGVDSFFTALRPREEPITLLLTMLGFASPSLVATGRLDRAMDEIAVAATRLGRDHVVVETNAYVFCAKYLPARRKFRNVQQGAVLSAMALGLGTLIRRCYIASSFPLTNLPPWGTHPAVDPLWSTEALEVVHDGVEFDREAKVVAIADNNVVLDTLRVCNTGTVEGNCRRCDKCQQTALGLYVAGTIDRSRTLGPVTVATLRRTVIIPRHFKNYERLLARTDDAELRAAITIALRRSKLRRLLRPLGTVLRRIGLRH